jgi:hypothetical protein
VSCRVRALIRRLGRLLSRNAPVRGRRGLIGAGLAGRRRAVAGALVDGSQVVWIETPVPDSSAAPEHPAPVLSLTAAASSGTTSGSAAAAPAASAHGASTRAATTGIVLGAVGVLLGAAALAVALMRRRLTPTRQTQANSGASNRSSDGPPVLGRQRCVRIDRAVLRPTLSGYPLIGSAT